MDSVSTMIITTISLWTDDIINLSLSYHFTFTVEPLYLNIQFYELHQLSPICISLLLYSEIPLLSLIIQPQSYSVTMVSFYWVGGGITKLS